MAAKPPPTEFTELPDDEGPPSTSQSMPQYGPPPFPGIDEQQPAKASAPLSPEGDEATGRFGVDRPLSPSVTSAIGDMLGRGGPCTSWQLALRVMQGRRDYADRISETSAFRSGEDDISGFEPRDPRDWLAAVDARMAPGLLLHARALVVGLSLVDPALRPLFDDRVPGLLEDVGRTIREPLDEVFPGLSPVLAGYVSDLASGADHLDITPEVRTIAHVLLSKDVRPPLSLGLFGDWGSGKSFFMGRLRDEIAAQAARHCRAAEAAPDDEPSAWCTRVVQIEFNAWHFSDENLWASLVTRIYGALFEALKGKEPGDDRRTELVRERAKAEAKAAQAQSTAEAARADVVAATTRVHAARVESAAKASELRGLIGTVADLLGEQSEVKTKLDDATTRLGVPEASRSYDALAGLHAELRSARTRTSAVAGLVARSPRSVAWLAAAVLALPLLVVAALAGIDAVTGSEWFGAAGRGVVGVASVVASVATWASVQLRRGVAAVAHVETAFAEAQARRVALIKENPKVKTAQAELVQAEGEEAAAVAALVAAETELERIERELLELRPDRQLARLLGDRRDDETYSQHLGLISHIRADFERMNGLLREWEMNGSAKGEAPPIQRIVLYIDDLDRCRPDRVVKVLEAIHLLLAFELFVVVVGVDPRWLRHSLALQYPDVLGGSGAPPSDDDGAALATPQDYLEKIFQIPYALRPVGEAGYRNLVGALAGPVGEGAGAETQETGAGRTNAEAVEGMSDGADGEAAGEDETPSPQPLVFTEQERRDIERLWPLFATPRTVKRFVNTYRLLRAGLGPGEVVAFEGTPDEPGEYQTALLLLAVVTGASRDANGLLDVLQRSVSHLDERFTPAPPWATVLDMVGKLRSSAEDEYIDEAWAEWRSGTLGALGGAGFDRRPTPEEVGRWRARVERFSYDVDSTTA